MKAVFRRLFRDRKAATAVEYGIILSLIVLAMIGALKNVASVTIDMWDNVSANVTRASGA